MWSSVWTLSSWGAEVEEVAGAEATGGKLVIGPHQRVAGVRLERVDLRYLAQRKPGQAPPVSLSAQAVGVGRALRTVWAKQS